jgi:hypothetical protein
MHMLGVADGRVCHGAVWLSELPQGNGGQVRPVGGGGDHVEPLVQVKAHPQAGLVDLEEAPQPGTEKTTMRGSLFAKRTAPSRLVPSPAYSATPAIRNSRSESRPTRALPSASRRSISACLRRCNAFGARWRPRSIRGRGTKSTSRTQRDTLLFDTSSRAAMSPSGRPCARNRRACSCSRSLPRYPMAGCWHLSVTGETLVHRMEQPAPTACRRTSTALPWRRRGGAPRGPAGRRRASS